MKHTPAHTHEPASRLNNFSPAWRTCDQLLTEFLKPLSDEMIRLLNPNGTDVILDVASGHGEPGLTIASKLAGGMVIITDLNSDLLTVARDHAQRRHIGNIDTWACDACDLPFADHTFDAISCRLGLMHFADTRLALQEMARVTKPGGRIAATVWDTPEKNTWATQPLPAIRKMIDTPALPSSRFHTGETHTMTDIFRQAGLNHIEVTPVALAIPCPTAEIYWHLLTETGTPAATVLTQTDEQTQRQIKKKVFETLADGVVQIEAAGLVAYGEKRQ